MANHKSAEKRHRQSLRRRDRNRAARSAVRTAVKTASSSLETAGKSGDAKALVVQAESMLASAAKKGILHPRTARRKISRLAKKASQQTAASASK